MILVNVSKRGTLKFQLKDGRHVLSYNSGYVRMDSGRSDRLYQINKVRRVKGTWKYYNYERILIPCPKQRYEYLLNFEMRNCK